MKTSTILLISGLSLVLIIAVYYFFFYNKNKNSRFENPNGGGGQNTGGGGQYTGGGGQYTGNNTGGGQSLIDCNPLIRRYNEKLNEINTSTGLSKLIATADLELIKTQIISAGCSIPN